MRAPAKMNVWAHKDAIQDLPALLDDNDVARLRESSKDWRDVVDSTLSKLAPVNLDCPLLTNRALPSLKSLHITQLQYLQPQQLLQCSTLHQLTQLHIGGTACSRLRTHHLGWIGRLTNLQELYISKCGKVKLSILSCLHSLTSLKTLNLIGLSVNPAGSSSTLSPFLASGAALNLTSLVLGDQQGLSFLSDGALEGLGELLGPVGRIRVLDLSGCIEMTDIGIQHLSGLTSLEHLSLHNCMKIATGATQTLASFKFLKTLNLRGCSQLSDTHVSPVLKTLTCLESLNLQACSGLAGWCLNHDICRGLVNLKTLNLSYCQGLGTSVFEGLVQLPQLEVLDTSGCNIVSGFEVLAVMGKLTRLTSLQGNYWRCKGPNHAAAAAAAGVGSSSPAVLLPPNLEHLSLNHLSCSEAFLEILVSHLPKTLTYLDLSQCSGSGPVSSPNSLQGLANLTLLQTLKLSSSLGGVPGCVLGFVSSLHNIKDLQLEYVHDTAPVTDVMAAALTNSSSSSSSTQWLQGLLGGSNISTTAVCSSTSTAAAAAAADGLQQQRSPAGVAQLLLGTAASSSWHCSSSTTGSSSSSSDPLAQAQVRRTLFCRPCSSTTVPEHSVFQNAPQQLQRPCLQGLLQLQTLTVTFSPWVTDQILAALSGLSCLTSLNLTACQNLTGSGFQAWISQGSSSSSSSTQIRRTRSHTCRFRSARSADSAEDRVFRPSLIHLNLTGCGGLTDQGLVAAVAACPKVQELLLPGCRGLGEEGVMQLGKLDRLKVLSLASNKNVTARSMAALFPSLRNLNKLSVSLCGSICDDALVHLAKAPSLANADLRGCWQVTDHGVYNLLSTSRALLQLNVDSCHRLSSSCCPDNFKPGGIPPPSPDSSSSRPGLLLRVATASRVSGGWDISRDNNSVEANDGQPELGPPMALQAASAGAREGSKVEEGSEACAVRFEMAALQDALQH